MAEDSGIQESWCDVDTIEGISHVHSNEEMTELLADAVTEKITQLLPTEEVPEDEESPLEFHCDTIPISPIVYQEETGEYNSEQQQQHGIINNIIKSIQSLIASLFNPVVIMSHLAVFSIGIYIGRRLVS